MAQEPNPQRAWRAACPNCGAPVDFASAASASAVCSFCRSTLVRDGDALRRIGSSAELFDDHSPLQLGTAGRYQGLAFTLVGRLQYGTDSGQWNEWFALFDGGTETPRPGWLSEDNGAYVFAFDAPLPTDAPPVAGLRAGQALQVGGRGWSVASTVHAHLIAAQGELPRPPRLDGSFTVVDLRNAQGDVATLDNSEPARLHWSVGRAVALSSLGLSGLRDAGQAAEKTLASRSLECPSCGAALAVTLASTRSIACGQCHAVVDVSQGVGADLQHYAQNNAGAAGLAPQIPLGNTGKLALGGAELPWQVVGYQERCDVPGADGDEGDGEQTFWREYLLYNRSDGFAFLVDAEDGWSWVKPLTGVPVLRGEQATWQGATFRKRESYRASVTWVQGEFYWRVRRGEVALVTDYEGTGEHHALRLSREQGGGPSGAAGDSEVTWSAGEVLAAASVADAFNIAPAARAALQRDAAPTAGSGAGATKGLLLFAALALLMIMLVRCGGDDCDEVRNTFGPASTEYQQCARSSGSGGGVGYGGGSYGGFSSGGGHK